MNVDYLEPLLPFLLFVLSTLFHEKKEIANVLFESFEEIEVCIQDIFFLYYYLQNLV